MNHDLTDPTSLVHFFLRYGGLKTTQQIFHVLFEIYNRFFLFFQSINAYN